MNVTKHIICELTGYRPGAVDVSQGDRGSRAVSCRLLANGAPWMIPDGATVRVAYTLPDGTDGLYDALPDGSPAGVISGNTVTVELADQLMDQAGMAQVSVLIIGPEGGQLATWPIRVMVGANKAARLTVPENMPPYGAGFAGKIFFGGADGTVTPLGIGEGVEIVWQEDGSYLLVAAGGGGGIQEEKDPTVPDWAKQPQKPSYTAEEVGADPAGTAAQLAKDKLDASALPAAINEALAQAKESGEFDGKDGVSVTHQWNGTVLTITSASGTSSADLRGPKGDTYSMTEADWNAIASIVINMLPKWSGGAY